MAAEYEVVSVEGTDEWESNHGPMIEWTLRCRNLANGREAVCSINTKAGGKEYNVGDTFHATNEGERNGIIKLKRQNPQFQGQGRGGSSGARGGSQGSGQGRGSSQGYRGAPAGSGAQRGASSRGAMPFDRAALLYGECIKAAKAIGGTEQNGTTLFLSVLRGEIQAPPIQARAPRTSDPDDRPPPPADDDDPGFDGDEEVPF